MTERNAFSAKETEREANQREEERRGEKPQSAARHTFLGSPWFRRWNRAARKLCMCASALMEFERPKAIREMKPGIKKKEV